MSTCRDRNCDPSKGDEGCMATIINDGAVDALDLVWFRHWDDCPVTAARRAASDADDAKFNAEQAWLAKMMRAAEAES